MNPITLYFNLEPVIRNIHVICPQSPIKKVTCGHLKLNVVKIEPSLITLEIFSLKKIMLTAKTFGKCERRLSFNLSQNVGIDSQIAHFQTFAQLKSETQQLQKQQWQKQQQQQNYHWR